MASIFLANAPYFLKERYGELAPVGATLPHLGLLMLGAVLREAGHRIRIWDASAQGSGYEETIDEVRRFRPDVIALTAVTPSLLKTVKLAEMLKALYPTAAIIIGGPHFTAVPEKTLLDYPAFDYGVMGEGEETLVDLARQLAAGNSPSDVPGGVFRQNGKVIFGPERPSIKDLDTLPFPAWDLLDNFPGPYHPALFKYKKLPATHIVSSRGCPNNCIFCDTSVFKKKIRYHSAEYVLEMVDHLATNYKIREIIFEDDQFLLNRERVVKICEGFLNARRKISWSCSGRVNSVNDRALLLLMKRSGCWQINYGVESGNQNILDFAQKGITLHQIETALNLTRSAGILSKAYFIFGLPYETEETMQRTIDFARRLPLDDMSVFTLTPFPGSRMYAMAAQHGTLQNDFEKMNLLDVVYVPFGLTGETLMDYRRKFMKAFYLRPGIIWNYLKRLIENPANVWRMLKAFRGFLAYTVKSIPQRQGQTHKRRHL